MKIKSEKIRLASAITAVSSALFAAPAISQQSPIWSDEFDGNNIDRDIWTYTTGGDGFGNGELQYYTASEKNAYIENGNLVIEAHRENFEGKEFTSARLHTNGHFGFRFGSLEARIKLPKLDNGLWPAFWMMGNNIGVDGWPKSGEIDILEAGFKSALDNGTANHAVSGAFHWWHETGTWSDWLQADASAEVEVPMALNEAYHTYRLDWTPDTATISVDGTEIISMDITAPEFSEFRDNPMHILLNLAVGGWNFVEITDPAQITAQFPAKMYVDYVRVYPNEYTEIEVPADSAPSGDFGVMTETHPVDAELDLAEANIYVWNNMAAEDTAPSEGSDLLSFRVNAGDWWGMGLLHPDYSMENYAHGTLNFDIKTSTAEPIQVNLDSTNGSQGSVLIEGDDFGLVRDGQWHSVSIPLAQLIGVDWSTVNSFFSISGAAPTAAFSIAVDNIYLSESQPLETPEHGSFGIYTETPAHSDAGNFVDGGNGDLFIWEDTLSLGSGDVREGENALHLSSTGKGWFGLGFTARHGFNLSAFDNENAQLHFSLRTTDQTEFRIGLKGGNVNDIGQKWIFFRAGEDPYGFARDGQWHDISIPVRELLPDFDIADAHQVFQLLGTGEISNLSIDDIYLSGGEDADQEGPSEPPLPPEDIALGKAVSVSSVENAAFTGEAAVDGDVGTRWSSAWSDPQWITVDLGSVQPVSQVLLNWEAAYASAYEIQFSTDGDHWTTVAAVSDGDGGTDEVAVDGSTRYVRMQGLQRATPYGYSLWSFEIY